MARDRRLPAFLAAVSSKRGTPVGANIFVVAIYAVWALLTVFWTGLFALPGTPHYSAMFSWGSTFGSFALALIYLLLAVGAVRGLRDHPKRWAVWLAVIVSLLVTGGAIYGSIYKVSRPTCWPRTRPSHGSSWAWPWPCWCAAGRRPARPWPTWARRRSLRSASGGHS